MALIRHLLKCDVCGAHTLLRTQLSWLPQHPLRVHCGKCGILISGTVYIDHEEVEFDFVFHNATVLESDATPDFHIEASAELLTAKLQVYTGDPTAQLATPFLRQSSAIGNERFQQFSLRTKAFIQTIDNLWPAVRRINELWLNGNHQYLAQQVAEFLPDHQYPMDSELECLRGVHQLNLSFLSPLLDFSRFEETTHLLWSEIDDLTSNSALSLLELVNHFVSDDILVRYETKIFSQIGQLVDTFKYLIPVFGMTFRDDLSDSILQEQGITTASFEDLKQFYLDSYEVASETINLVIAFNNLKHRGSFEQMKIWRKDVQTIADFDSKTKGVRIGFLDGNETFDNLLYPHLDNKIRNAIGHNSYKYDGVRQVITYFPSGRETASDAQRIYLLEFGRDCWNIFLCLVDLAELIYQTRKVHFVSLGQRAVHPSVFGHCASGATPDGAGQP